MKRPVPSSKLSDRELNAMLQSLREDVAAPPAFRGQVLGRLAEAGLIQAQAAPQREQASLRVRLVQWFSPARLGLLAGGACALALVLTLGTPAPKLSVDAPPALAKPRPLQPPSPPCILVMGSRRAKSAALQAEAAEESFKSEPVVARAEAPAAAEATADSAPVEREAMAIGAGPVPATSQAMGLAAASAAPSQAPAFSAGAGASSSLNTAVTGTEKPTVIVIEPTPTPLVKALAGDSEVRNNVVRASRGESALVIFRIQQAGAVRVSIHDRLGWPVAVLKDASLAPGTYQLRWNGAADEGGMAAAGIYELRIQAPGYEARHKLGLVK